MLAIKLPSHQIVKMAQGVFRGFQQLKASRDLKAENCLDPLFTRLVYYHDVLYKAISLWNSLDNKSMSSKSLLVFKKNILYWNGETCFCEICKFFFFSIYYWHFYDI